MTPHTNPWAAASGLVTPPQWCGPTTVNRLCDDEPAPAQQESKEPARQPSDSREQLQHVAARATAAILEVLPPWTLIEPGSAKEALARKVPAGFWWPFPQEAR